MTSTLPRKRFSLSALVVTVATCAVLLGAADRMLGLPDMSLVREFIGGGRPGHQAALATSSLLVWTALVAVCAWLILTSCEGLPHAVGRSVWPLMDPGIVVMVVGICLLAIAVTRHVTASPPQMCCGSVQEAAQSLGH